MVYRSGADAAAAGGQPSLVEQKKRQWAREKEENARLDEFSAHTHTVTSSIYHHHHHNQQHQQQQRTSIRTYFSQADVRAANLQPVQPTVVSTSNAADDDGGAYYETASEVMAGQRVRSPSLPPLRHHRLHRQHPQYVSTEDDTSGYISDQQSLDAGFVGPTRPLRIQRPPYQLPHDATDHVAQHRRSRSEAPSVYAAQPRRRGQSPHSAVTDATDLLARSEANFSVAKRLSNVHSSYATPTSSTSSGSSDSGVSPALAAVASTPSLSRRKWSDGPMPDMQTRHYYEALPAPSQPSIDETIMDEDESVDAPSWLSRGVQQTRRGSGVESVLSFSFIRGQNAPIDARTLSERATRRARALETQTALKQQLVDAERRRRSERAERARDERNAEELLQRQLEAERERLDRQQSEQRAQMEAQRRREEALREALQRAEEEARRDRERLRREQRSKVDQQPKTSPLLVESVPSSSQSGPFLIGSPIKMRKPPTPFDETPVAGIVASQASAGQPDATHSTEESAKALGESTAAASAVTSMLLNNVYQQPPTSTTPQAASNYISLNNLQFAVMLAHQIEQMAPASLLAKLQQPQQEMPPSVESPPAPPVVQCETCQMKIEQDKLKNNQSSADESTTVATTKMPPVPHERTFTKEDSKAPISRVDRATQTDQLQPAARDVTTNQIAELTECPKSIDVVDDSVGDADESDALFETNDDAQQELTTTTTTTLLTTTTTITTKGRDLTPTPPPPPPPPPPTSLPLAGQNQPRRLDRRPKWGVNRPPQQYVKATDRDPRSSLRPIFPTTIVNGAHRHNATTARRALNRHRSYAVLEPPQIGEHSTAEDDDDDHGQLRSTASTNEKRMFGERVNRRNNARRSAAAVDADADFINVVDKTPALPAMIGHRPASRSHSPADSERSQGGRFTSARDRCAMGARSVCTEIVPIRTDRFGQIYVNYAGSTRSLSERRVPPVVSATASGRRWQRLQQHQQQS